MGLNRVGIILDTTATAEQRTPKFVMTDVPARHLSTALRQWACRYGERPALIGSGESLTFAALDAAADRWGGVAMAAGWCGRHVGLLAPNRPAWLAAAFGMWRAGATVVPISTFVTTRELTEQVAHADLDALILQPRLDAHDYAAMVDKLPASIRPAEVVPLSLVPDAPAGAVSAARRSDRAPTAPMGREPRAPSAAPSAAADPHADDPANLDPESIACILYTSGTTGRPKGVMLSHRAILATVGPTAERGGLGADDALLSTLPLFWVAGLVIRALPTLASGCALLLIERFSADGVLAMLREHRPTGLHLRPPQVAQLLSHRRFDPSVLARVRRGGGRVEWFHPHLDPEQTRLITGYGMTETAGYVTATDWRAPAAVREREIGTPLPGVRIRITDEQGQPCPPDVAGEIRIHTPALFSGYYKQPPGTARDEHGFLRTGDIGCFDAAGRFQFAGRTKDLLRVKGINVAPAEVEAVLGAHPDVDGVYVVGLPPDGLEQEVVALVVTRGDRPLPEAALRRAATDGLSHYKRPTRYLQISHRDVPLSATSKPQRAQLAALATARLRSDPI